MIARLATRWLEHHAPLGFIDVLTSDLSRESRARYKSEEARGRITQNFESSTLDSAVARRAGEFPHNLETTNGGRYPPRVMQAAGILDHLDASDMKTKTL